MNVCKFQINFEKFAFWFCDFIEGRTALIFAFFDGKRDVVKAILESDKCASEVVASQHNG